MEQSKLLPLVPWEVIMPQLFDHDPHGIIRLSGYLRDGRCFAKADTNADYFLIFPTKRDLILYFM